MIIINRIRLVAEIKKIALTPPREGTINGSRWSCARRYAGNPHGARSVPALSFFSMLDVQRKKNPCPSNRKFFPRVSGEKGGKIGSRVIVNKS